MGADETLAAIDETLAAKRHVGAVVKKLEPTGLCVGETLADSPPSRVQQAMADTGCHPDGAWDMAASSSPPPIQQAMKGRGCRVSQGHAHIGAGAGGEVGRVAGGGLLVLHKLLQLRLRRRRRGRVQGDDIICIGDPLGDWAAPQEVCA